MKTNGGGMDDRSGPLILLVAADAGMEAVLHVSLQRRGYRVHARGILDLMDGRLDLTPDVVVLANPQRDGSASAVVRVLRGWTTVPVLILADPQDAAQSRRALLDGATDYLPLLVGGAAVDAWIRHMLTQVPDRRPRCAEGTMIKVGGQRLVLPRLEAAILDLLLQSPGRIVPDDVLLTAVWGAPPGDFVAALRTTIRRLRQRLAGVEPGVSFIVTEPGIGYRLMPSAALTMGLRKTHPCGSEGCQEAP
jgi:two-component system, OmpR family, KDP operon response regulator KdpE